ncbi:MAG TPA: hypothetical protein VNT56_01695 [Acidimicrobiales bacterium]|jgi:anti-anti-sigma factor|nr:hypothetical protein [Acidimicrobiales bacterium]
MTVEVHVRQNDEVLEVSLSGAIDREVAEVIDGAVLAVAGRTRLTLVNLDGAVLIDRDGLQAMVRRLVDQGGTARVGLVCGRSGSVELLRRWGISHLLPVYPSFDDALRREPSAGPA